MKNRKAAEEKPQTDREKCSGSLATMWQEHQRLSVVATYDIVGIQQWAVTVAKTELYVDCYENSCMECTTAMPSFY